MDGFIKAVKGFEFFDKFGIKSLCAAILAGLADGIIHCGGSGIAAAAAEALGGGGIVSLKLRDHALHGAAGNKLHNDKADQQDAEQSREHQENAF